jgi:eukaryotic-like serine/threonine-protein kinase
MRGDGMIAEGAFVGQRIAGGYTVVRTLARGGMGHVWLARSDSNGQLVAVKKCVVPDGLSPYEQKLVRNWALQEARAAARVDHPNVIRIIDVVAAEDEPWIVMEYVPSRSLLTIIEEDGPLPPARVAAIGLAVLNGLDAIHRAGVLHLDVKPGNVLVGDDGRIVLTDFGPAVTPEGVAAFARAGIILGSPKYIAPERLFDDSTTAASDLWSLGATLYHAIEGRPPYLRETTAETLLALDGSPPDRPHRAGPLQPLLDGLLTRDPAGRMAPAELADRLRRQAGTRAPGRRLPLPTITVPRRRLGVAAAGVVALGALAGVVAATQHGDDTSRSAGPPPAPSVVASSAAPAVLPSLPPRYTWWNDPSGYRVAVPAGWKHGADSGGTRFIAPAGEPVLQIHAWTPAPPNVLAALLTAEHNEKLPGYRRIGITPQGNGAVWEYTYSDSSGRPMRCLEQVTTLGGRTYVLEWHTPRDAWPAGLPTLSVVRNSFGLKGL